MFLLEELAEKNMAGKQSGLVLLEQKARKSVCWRQGWIEKITVVNNHLLGSQFGSQQISLFLLFFLKYTL